MQSRVLNLGLPLVCLFVFFGLFFYKNIKIKPFVKKNMLQRIVRFNYV